MVNTDDQILSINFVPEGEILALRVQFLKDFFYLLVKKRWVDWRALMQSIFKIEFIVATLKVES